MHCTLDLGKVEIVSSHSECTARNEARSSFTTWLKLDPRSYHIKFAILALRSSWRSFWYVLRSTLVMMLMMWWWTRIYSAIHRHEWMNDGHPQLYYTCILPHIYTTIWSGRRTPDDDLTRWFRLWFGQQEACTVLWNLERTFTHASCNKCMWR